MSARDELPDEPGGERVPLPGSVRRPSSGAERVGDADPDERFDVTIVLRRRPDAEPLPDFEHFLGTSPAARPRLSPEEFARRYGAAPEDVELVTAFATDHGLTVERVDAAARSVVVSGTVAQMNAAFGVELGTYEHEVSRRSGEEPTVERYRGRDGAIHVPAELVDVVVGIFGLDNRAIAKKNPADPPGTATIAIDTLRRLYRFPTNSAAGQTIAIFSSDGYVPADISASFGGSPPSVVDISVDAANNGQPDAETTQDIVIAGKAAPGANIAVYFTTYSQQGWVDLVQRVAHPHAGDPVCSVLSSSYYVSNGDDAATLAGEGVSAAWVNALTLAFQDAAIQGVTVCIASGDTGTQSKKTDGKAHVQYPGSDPWVLSVGGTTVGNVSGDSFDEYVWNDSSGATGGGVSDFFPVPSYQAGVNVPPSLNDGTHRGRGVPDVAANGSGNAGYTPVTVNGAPGSGTGTSASAPLWAGLIAVLNAALGTRLGFVNPALYAIGSRGFNDVVAHPGAADNGFAGVAGYPAGPGWDACTGWGSPNGTALLAALRTLYPATTPTPAAPARASLLIPSAVALLAHKRLRDVVEALERKAGGGFYDALSFAGSSEPVVFTDTERRVLALAKAAQRMFEAGPSVDAADSLPVGQGLGRFAVAGSAAFQLPAYAELWERNGSWVAETLRRGTPDENLSKVVVGSSQVAVRTGELGLGLVADDAAQARIQSFSMGMLSGLASAVVVDPVLRGLQTRRTKQDWNQGLPVVDVAAAERRIVQNLLGGAGGGAAWQGWWPKPDDVPDALLDGYLKAIDEAFGIATNRPKGFADYEQRFAASTPPALTRARLRDGYSLLQLDVNLTPWGAGTWYVALLPMLVVPVVGFALVRALPHGKAFVDPSVQMDERAAWELLTLATGLGALAPAGYSIYLWTQIPENTEAFVEAVVIFGVRAALALGSLAAGGAGAGVRWGLLYAPLALTDVYGLIRGLIEKGRGSPAGFVFLLQTLPVLTGATVLLFALIADALIAAGLDHDVAYVVVLAAMAALLLAALGIPLAVALSHGGGLRSIMLLDRPQVADSLTAVTESGGPAALAALFDDSTLWFDPAVHAPTLADLRYPSGRRALLRVWWTGGGDLQITHDDRTVVFRRTADGSTKQVDLPPGKTSAADLAALLVAQMPGIEAEPFAAADPEYDLPWPHTLTDPGDTQPTLAAHDLHAHDFAPIGTSRESAYVLRHTPRTELTTTYGVSGPSRSQLDAIPVVPAQMLGDLEQSALGTAADLAALLCMGAAPSLAGSAAAGSGGGAPAEVPGPLTAFTPAGAAPLPGSLGPVFQVFRQWNLDERRVNEWRQLVHGGAASDQPDPVHADPGMRPDPRVGAPAYASAAQGAPPAAPAPAPELVARALGWVPLWRAWSRMAADITADASAASPMHYTPSAALGDGTDFQLTNADLTNGIRYLLDLP